MKEHITKGLAAVDEIMGWCDVSKPSHRRLYDACVRVRRTCDTAIAAKLSGPMTTMLAAYLDEELKAAQAEFDAAVRGAAA